jgi:DNA-binding SARP family transcriptional activator
MIADLAAERILVPLNGDGEYRYRRPLRVYLRHLLARRGDEDRRTFHQRTAATLIQRQVALDALEEGEEPEPAAPAPEQEPEPAWAPLPPPPPADPGVATLEREVADRIAAGAWEPAADALARALKLLVAVGGQQEKGLLLAERSLARLPAGTRAEPSIRLLMAGMHARACRYAEAGAEMEAAGRLPAADRPGVAIQSALVRAHAIDHPLGRSETALAALAEVVARLREEDVEDRERLLRASLAARTRILIDLGRHDEALAEADRLRDAPLSQAELGLAWRAAAGLRLTALAVGERWPELAAELPAAADALGGLDGAERSYALDLARAALAAQEGDAAALRRAALAARSALRAHAGAFEQSIGLSELARAAHVGGLAGVAAELAHEAALAARLARAPLAAARAVLIAAAAEGPGGKGDGLLARALGITAQHGLEELWARCERRLAEDLLARAADLGLEPELVARLRAAGAPPAPARRPAPAAPPARPAPAEPVAIELRTLGGLVVVRGGEALGPAAFGRQKARTLLAILVSAPGAVHREVLLHHLWPDLPTERGLTALHSTLYALRRAVEPGASARGRGSRVRSEGAAYRLVLRDGDRWDAGAFLELAAVAGAARGRPEEIERIAAALAAHTGPYLPEFLYEEWAAEVRARVDNTHLQLLERMVHLLIDADRREEAIDQLRELLAIEPAREEWHRELIRLLGRSGERALALRQYHECRRHLKEQFGVEPGPETQALYLRLLREGVPGEPPRGR